MADGRKNDQENPRHVGSASLTQAEQGRVSSQPSNPAMGPLRSADALFPSHTGQARRSKAGLDVLLTKAAIDFQNLWNQRRAALVRLNLEALREAAGLDALLIASFDAAHTVIEHVVGVTGLLCTFNPATAPE